MAKMGTRAIERELDRIRSLDLEELRVEWRRLYHSEPPRISRDLLVLSLGYRLQEIEHGGLGKSTRRKLQTMAKVLRTTGRIAPTPSLSLKPGARLMREWRGRTHTVTVTEDGFEYAGTSYPSLTKIANEITGAHWSGPRFFGLAAPNAERPLNGRRDG
jgi:heterodisulfide reductase subunit A-like polyferredoxin